MLDSNKGQRTHKLTALVQGALWAATTTVVLGFIALENVAEMESDAPWYAWWPLLVLPVLILVSFIAGVAQWAFTRYVIDENEFRLDKGLIFKSSRRVPFERIQSVDVHEPLLARIFNLAELKIESAGGSGSQTSVKFLPLTEAQRLRTVLLNQAHGRHDDAPEVPRSVITKVAPERIMIATLISLDFAFSVLLTIGALVALIATGMWWIALAVVVPSGTWLFQIIGQRVIADWDFTLSDGERGLRIERGLLSRTSQTIPLDRVQGFRIEQPFIWRRFGWMRLRVDVAGYSGEQSSDSGTDTQSTLLPISTVELVHSVMERLVVGASELPSETFSPQRKAFAPIGWKYRSIGFTDVITRAESGWIYRSVDIVPHRKVQSVAIHQGPLQRRWNIATIEIHTPEGPVNAQARHLNHGDAQTVINQQIDHARRARR